ncbi:hypothetical protein [Rummeliibacillus pycnus]|nr:hypothetical protein [Rummeliibacillus pycnus]
MKDDPSADFQEIVVYQLTDKRKAEYELYKVQMKKLERNRALLDKA